MRWLTAFVLLDVVVVAWLIAGAAEREEADLVFVSSSAHHWLDPQQISWTHDIRIAECLFEPLTRIKLPEMVVEPAVAQSWQINDDGLTYTFDIRDDARWSNGDAVTAGDFIYAWRRALLPDHAADYTHLLWVIKGAREFFTWRQNDLAEYAKNTAGQNEQEANRRLEKTYERFEQMVGLSAPDNKTLVVELARPVPYFLQLCAFITYVPVHEATVEPQTSISVASGRLVQDPYWTRPKRLISNGPYVLARRRFKRDVLLEANEHYWNREAMGNSAILERIVNNSSNALLLYEAGEVNWLPDIPSSGSVAADLAAQNRDDVHVIPAAGTYFYNFNCKAKLPDGSANPLADARVRRALSMAIDREAIITNITRLGQPPARTFVPLGALPGYNAPVEAGVTFDPEQARSLLAQAGYGTEPGQAPLKGLSILYNTGHEHEKIAQVIKRTWEEHLGVIIQLDGQEGAVFGDRLKKQNYSIARAGWFGDYLDPTTFLDKFVTGNGNNDAAYSSAAFDALMAKAADELDFVKRMVILGEAEAMMLRDQPIAPIYQYVNFRMYDPERVKHMHPNPWNFRRLELVRTDF